MFGVHDTARRRLARFNNVIAGASDLQSHLRRDRDPSYLRK
jgi:hypothetical protein